MSQAEFVKRFTDRIISRAIPPIDPDLPRYCAQEAQAYLSYGLRNGGPEECADDLMSDWGKSSEA